MLIDGLGRTIQADREREIRERLRARGLLEDTAGGAGMGDRKVTPTEPQGVGSIGIRSALARISGIAVQARSR